MRQSLPLALGIAVSLSCGERGKSSDPTEVALGASPQIAPAPFVVFATPKMVIDQLGRPVPAPVTVGSQPSPETLSSGAPDVVEVTAAGALVARRNGRATVRARGGGESQLEVEVRAVSAFSVRPSSMTLRPGARGKLEIIAAGSGEPIPPEAAVWSSDAPRVAVVIAGDVEAGDKPGAANIVVTYGGQTARAKVAVAPGDHFEIRPQRPRVRVGEVLLFEAVSRAGPVPATWRARDPSSLRWNGSSAFVAVTPGKNEVCAEAGRQSACTEVIVTK